MSRYATLFMTQLRTSVATAMQYRANFFIESALSVAWLAIALLPLIVLFEQRDSVAGWDKASALIVMAYFMAVKAIMEGMVSPSLVALVEKIRTGAFDYVLLKPVDSQFMVSTAGYEPQKAIDLAGAIALACYAFSQRGVWPTADQLGIGVLLLASGVLAMYSLWVICAAASFWVVRLDNLIYLLQAIFDTARWPIQVFRGAWRFLFTFIIPVAIMTTFPAMALLGRLSARTTLLTLGGSLVMLLVSRVIWRAAIRNYTSASS
ncbi:MAG TPA: ABC-2 family transporter protein [Kofleriaceae bacterium]|nr:ABC-2 family transporter protein [Kofleriaceae bacterium]